MGLMWWFHNHLALELSVILLWLVCCHLMAQNRCWGSSHCIHVSAGRKEGEQVSTFQLPNQLS